MSRKIVSRVFGVPLEVPRNVSILLRGCSEAQILSCVSAGFHLPERLVWSGFLSFRSISGLALLFLIKLFGITSGYFSAPEISSRFFRACFEIAPAAMLQTTPMAAVESRKKFRADFEGPLTSIFSRFSGSKVLIDPNAPYIVTSTLD